MVTFADLAMAVEAAELNSIQLVRRGGWWHCEAQRGKDGWSRSCASAETWPEALAAALEGVIGKGAATQEGVAAPGD